jgi:hypothetical protein
MPERHEVVMQMVAELDEANVQTEAAQMAQSVAQTIEKAFEGLGDKIAQELMRGLDQVQQRMGGQGVGLPGGAPGGGGGGGGGAPEGLIAPPVPGPPPGSEPFMTGSTASGVTTPALAATQGGYVDPWLYPSKSFSGMAQQIGVEHGIGTMGVDAGGDAMLSQIRTQQMKQKMGLRGGFSEQELENINLTKGQYQSQFEEGEDLQGTLAERAATARGRTQQYEGLARMYEEDDPRRAEFTAKAEEAAKEETALKDSIVTLNETMRGLHRSFEELEKAGRTAPPPSMGAAFGRGIGVAGAIAYGLSTLPGAMRAGQVGGAALENMESRSLAGGDLSRLMAIDQLGGQGALQGEGRTEAGMAVGGQLAMGVGGLIAGGMTGNPLVGMAGAGFAMGGLRSAFQFNAMVQQRVEQIIGTEQSKNQIIYQSMGRGAQLATGAFRGAQAMGDPALSEFLTADVGEYRNQDAAKAEVERLESKLAGMPEMLTGWRSVGSGVSEHPNARRARTEQQLEEAQELATQPGGGLYQFGVNKANLGNQQIMSLMREVGGSMGGAFFGQGAPTMAMDLMDPEMKTMMLMKGQGFSNVGGVAGQMFGGGTGEGSAVEQRQLVVKDLEAAFERAINAGLDRAKIPEVMAMMGQRAAQIGLGGADVAQRDLRIGLEGAGKVFGPEIEGFELQETMNVQQGAVEAISGNSGPGAIFGLNLAAEIIQEHAPPTNIVKEKALQSFAKNGNKEAMARFFFGSTEQKFLDKAEAMLNEFKGGAPGAIKAGAAGLMGLPGTAEEGTNAAQVTTLAVSKVADTNMQRTQLLEDLADAEDFVGPRRPANVKMTQKDIDALNEGEGAKTTVEDGKVMRGGKQIGVIDRSFDVQTADTEGGKFGKFAKGTEQADAQVIAGGMNTLGGQLVVVGESLYGLYNRVQELQAKMDGKVTKKAFPGYGGSGKESNESRLIPANKVGPGAVAMPGSGVAQ